MTLQVGGAITTIQPTSPLLSTPTRSCFSSPLWFIKERMQPVPAHTAPCQTSCRPSEFLNFCKFYALQRGGKPKKANGSSYIIAAAFAPHLDDPNPSGIFHSGSLLTDSPHFKRGSIFAGTSPLAEF